MGQKDGEKWGAAADLQPTTPKFDRLLGRASESALLGDDPEVVKMSVVQHASYSAEKPKFKCVYRRFTRIE
jgi:hypothetical protein